MLNATGEWEAVQPSREEERPLSEARAFHRGKYRAAESVSSVVQGLIPKGTRLCRLEKKGERNRRYGYEVAAANETSDGMLLLNKTFRRLASIPKNEALLERGDGEEFVRRFLSEELQLGSFHDLVVRGKTLYYRASVSDVLLPVYLDSEENALFSPEKQSLEVKTETHYHDEVTGEIINPSAGSPAHAWRKLGLIDDQGNPTRRGILFSFFQHGEGLAVAAALEDPHYPIDEMVLHFANLRAGHRFELNDSSVGDNTGSERLAAACRQAFGPVDYEGYLRLGLPYTYGEGAAEVIQVMIEGKLHALFSKGREHLEFGHGDIERAFVEWLSFLRHIWNAPDLSDYPRWSELKVRCAGTIEKARPEKSAFRSPSDSTIDPAKTASKSNCLLLAVVSF